MRKMIVMTAVALSMSLNVAWAANSQQNKMTSCNHEASGKKGAERKTFMKQCLAAKKQSQQEKMKTCNADASGKKGAERKAFMKQCLSN